MIEFKTGTDVIDWESLVELYYQTDLVIGLGRARDLEKIKKAFLNTYKVVTGWENGRRERHFLQPLLSRTIRVCRTALLEYTRISQKL